MFANGFAFAAMGLIVGVAIGFKLGGLDEIVICALIGTSNGFLAGLIYDINLKYHRVLVEIKKLKNAATVADADKAPATAPVTEPVAPRTAPVMVKETPAPVSAHTTEPAPVREFKPEPATARTQPTTDRPAMSQQADWITGVGKTIRSFFTDGNVVVRIGLIILFIGVAFLVKYASDRSLLPIQLRLASVAAGGLALLILGWRLRKKRELYALLLQGGGVGVLYLTVYASTKLYGLLPTGFSFAFLFGLVVLSSLLAILQNAKSLALFGAAGGFLAPVLLSTGTGSHVTLFSYYLLLNAGILSIAWFKSWRSLNLLGFVFTFVIGTTWGVLKYNEQHFASTEPFLIIFFVLFAMVSVLYALRQPPKLVGYVDSTLVFGLPIISFALQAAMVQKFEYGMAYSAFAMSAFYILLASSLWKRGPSGMRLLCEAFLAMGVVFGSLAIPLALEGAWTSAAWSLEGLGLVWVGIRQGRTLARAFGMLLLIGGGVFFLEDYHSPVGMPFLNSHYLGALLISMAALLTSLLFYKNKPRTHSWEQAVSILIFVWGMLWWYGAGLHEIVDIHPDKYILSSLIAFFTTSMLLQLLMLIKTDWQYMRFPTHGLLPALCIIFVLQISFEGRNVFEYYGWLAWPVAIASQYYLLYRLDDAMHVISRHLQHMFSLWLLVLLSCAELSWGISQYISENRLWADLLWALLPAVVVLSLSSWAEKLRWPVQKHYELYVYRAALPIVTGLILFAAVQGLSNVGTPYPLNYIPFINPLDMIIALVMAMVIYWHHRLVRFTSKKVELIPAGARLGFISVALFFWLTGIIARTVHYWFNVPFDDGAMFDSIIFQASVSVTWSLLALTVTVFATKKSRRLLWFIGSALLGLVVIKLFLVDLASAGTIGRIISFVAVGLLMLVIGYFSPLPPRKEITA